MRMMHIYKSNIYRSMICRISQKPRNDRKIKTVKFLFFFFFFFFLLSIFMRSLKNKVFPSDVLSNPHRMKFRSAYCLAGTNNKNQH